MNPKYVPQPIHIMIEEVETINQIKIILKKY